MSLGLTPMPAARFAPFMADLKQRYVADRMQANLFTAEEADAFTDSQWMQFLPEGQATPGHFFFELTTRHQARGEAWLYIDDETGMAFLYELFLHEDARGQGLGREALTALAVFAETRAARTFCLNVFAHNERAKALYRSFGFREVSSDMVMPLPASS